MRDDIVLIASGRFAKPNEIAIAIALGADMINIARANMIASGCIMARRCHTNTCPVGIATQAVDVPSTPRISTSKSATTTGRFNAT